MTVKYVLYDLDDTLYPKSTPIMPIIGERIKTFLMENLNLNYREASTKRTHYNQTYGTVIRGLLQEETVDINLYLDYVHDISVHKFLTPNPALKEMLLAMPLRKFIFTNSYRKHAENVITALGIDNCFEEIFDIQTINYVSKPAKYPYSTVVNLLDTTADSCIYIDDQARNLKEPKLMGMKTILVDNKPDKWVDMSVNNVLETGEVIQCLVNQK